MAITRELIRFITYSVDTHENIHTLRIYFIALNPSDEMRRETRPTVFKFQMKLVSSCGRVGLAGEEGNTQLVENNASDWLGNCT